MKIDTSLVRALGLLLVTGCSSGGSHPAASGSNEPTPTGFDYEDETVQLDKDLVIASGTTVRVGPGVTFVAATDVKIDVQGTLEVAATADSPTHFFGPDVNAPAPSSWHGIEIASGGKLVATHVDVQGAQYGLHALAGSTYTIDYATFGTSFKPAVLESDGSFDHSTFEATTPPNIAVTLEVSIDDPNGTMTIMNASPSVKNSYFEGFSAFTDMVRIGGASSPVFDHVRLNGAHCGFHNYGSTNNSPRVTNSIIEHMSYGAMAFTSKPIFENCNFENNTDDVGYCFGAKAENAPVLTSNYYLSGDATVDASCFQVGTAAAATVTAPIEGAGPVGL